MSLTRANHVVAQRKTTLKRLGRTLSIDPRSRRVAWAYFKDGDLQDCRIRNFRDQTRSARISSDTIPYVIELLDHYAPHALLVPRIKDAGARRRSSQVARVIRTVVREALHRGIAVHVMSGDTVKKSFEQRTGEPAGNKEDIHKWILEQFQELTVMVPAPRLKAWEPEQYFTPLFNTVAMYLAWEALPSPMEKRA